VIRHTIEPKRHRNLLRVVVELDLDEALGMRETPEYRAHVGKYFSPLAQAVLDVLDILAKEPEYGEVKWFDDQKGYGFIRGSDSQDFFVHYRGIVGDGFRTLEKGQRVRFKRQLGRGTLEAVEVEPLVPGEDGPEAV